MPEQRSVVYVRKAAYATAAPVVRELMGHAGLDFRGKRVLVKPNILSGNAPERAVTTHPAIVSAVVDWLTEVGAEVTVGDNPGIGGYGASLKAAEKAGIVEASRGRFANIVLESRSVAVKSTYFNALVVSKAVLDADLIVNLPKFKTHGFCIYTGAVKNMFGMLVGAEKARIHAAGVTPERFGEALVDVFAVRPPELSLIDGVDAMEGNGPADGKIRHVGLLGLSRDPVALDAVFIRLMGIDPAKVHHVRIASERGHGRMRAEEITVDGDPPRIKPFVLPASRAIDFLGDTLSSAVHAIMFPGIAEYARLRLVKKGCTRCGTCVKACPTGAMKTDGDRHPYIVKETCIACYCCHELCPERAWKMKGLMGILQRRRAE